MYAVMVYTFTEFVLYNMHNISYGIVSDIIHSNMVNIYGVSKNFPTIYFVPYD